MNVMNISNFNWNLVYIEIFKENYGKWLFKIDVLKCNKYLELIVVCFGLVCLDICICYCFCLIFFNKWFLWFYC